MLDRIFSLVRVTRKLVMGKNAVIVATSSAGVETSIDVAELAALNDIGAVDLQKIDGITNGTALANKALVLGASKEIATITTATVTTVNNTTLNSVSIDAGASGTAGTVDVFPTTAAKGKLAITAADSAGDTITTIVNASQAAARTYTIPDAGAAASFVMTEGAQTLNGVKTIPAIITTNIDAGASGTAGTVDVFPATAAKGKLAVSVADQSGDTTVSLVVGAMAAARTITVRDPGAAASLLTTTDATAAATTATAAQLTRVAAGALHATATFDPASLVDGAGETSAAITVTGAAFGDFVLVGAPYDLVGITVTGYVSAADAVKIRVQNESGATVDLASGTWAIRVLKLNA